MTNRAKYSFSPADRHLYKFVHFFPTRLCASIYLLQVEKCWNVSNLSDRKSVMCIWKATAPAYHFADSSWVMCENTIRYALFKFVCVARRAPQVSFKTVKSHIRKRYQIWMFYGRGKMDESELMLAISRYV